MSILKVAAEKPGVGADVIFHAFGFPVSNSLLMIFLVLATVIVFSRLISKRLKMVPGRTQSITEILYESMEKLVLQITGSKEVARQIFPLVASLFVFFGLSNLLGLLIPFLGSITYGGAPVFRTPTTDFNTTLSIAFAMILIVQVASIRKWGILAHLSNYFKFHEIIDGFKKGVGAGIMGIVNFLIGLLDIISEVARVISLSVRLFGNMFAGEMLAIIILGFLAYGLPAVWMGMNIFVGFIQAMVFGSLTAAYYSLAVKGEEAS